MPPKLKALGRVLLNTLPDTISNSARSAKNRSWWKRADDLHYEYFEAYRDRLPFIQAAKEFLDGRKLLTPRIIEFGCSGGNNLRLIRELGWPVSYCGLDVQPAAIAFAREHFPHDTFFVCDDRQLLELSSRLGHFSLFVAAAVFYYLSPSSAQAVLQTAGLLADYVLICDDLSHFDEPKGGNDGGLFLHPYKAMCPAADLEVMVGPIRELNPGNRHGFFIARKRMNKSR